MLRSRCCGGTPLSAALALLLLFAALGFPAPASAGIAIDARLGVGYRYRKFFNWNPIPLSLDAAPEAAIPPAVFTDAALEALRNASPSPPSPPGSARGVDAIFANSPYGNKSDIVGPITPSAVFGRFAPLLADAVRSPGTRSRSAPWRSAADVQRIHDTLVACLGGGHPRCAPHEDLVRARRPPPYAELFRHHRALLKVTAPLRGSNWHSYHNYNGPWLEGYFQRAFFSLPFAAWYPIVPVFIPATDVVLQQYGSASREWAKALFAVARNVFRNDTIYLIVSQHDHSVLTLDGDCSVFQNFIVLSSGGWGNIPLPLLNRPVAYHAPPTFVAADSAQTPPLSSPAAAASAGLPSSSAAASVRRHLVSFMGTVEAGRHDANSLNLTLWEYSRYRMFAFASMIGLGFDAAWPHMLYTRPFAARRTPSPGNESAAAAVPAASQSNDWLRVLLDSALVLSPRGFGATSFRMYEALQAGRVPLYMWGDLEPLIDSQPPLEALRPFAAGLDEATDAWLGLREVDGEAARAAARKQAEMDQLERPWVAGSYVGRFRDSLARSFAAGQGGAEKGDIGATKSSAGDDDDETMLARGAPTSSSSMPSFEVVYPAFETLVREAMRLPPSYLGDANGDAASAAAAAGNGGGDSLGQRLGIESLLSTRKRGVEWLPYRRVRPSLWGWGGVGLVSHFADAAAVTRHLCKWLTPIPGASCEGPAQCESTRDAEVAIASAKVPFDVCSIQVIQSRCRGSGAGSEHHAMNNVGDGACLWSINYTAAGSWSSTCAEAEEMANADSSSGDNYYSTSKLNGKRANVEDATLEHSVPSHDFWMHACAARSRKLDATNSCGPAEAGGAGVVIPETSMLARMEARLASARDDYFTQEAVVARIAEFVERPWDSALTCEGKVAASILIVEANKTSQGGV